jgi:hypothetical protein
LIHKAIQRPTVITLLPGFDGRIEKFEEFEEFEV